MNWINIALNLVGLGKELLSKRAERKKVEVDSKIKIAIARTEAEITRIKQTTKADNSIDLESVRQLNRTWKDEIIILLFLIPIFSAAIVPFILAYKSNQWESLNLFMVDSYRSLEQLPEWYPYVIGLILISTFGFRSLLRKGIGAFGSRFSRNKK